MILIKGHTQNRTSYPSNNDEFKPRSSLPKKYQHGGDKIRCDEKIIIIPFSVILSELTFFHTDATLANIIHTNFSHKAQPVVVCRLKWVLEYIQFTMTFKFIFLYASQKSLKDEAKDIYYKVRHNCQVCYFAAGMSKACVALADGA